MKKAVEEVKAYLLQLQKDICNALESQESAAKFKEDPWKDSKRGHGITAVLEGGEVIERGGVSFSHVSGEHLPKEATTRYPNLVGCGFQAMGVSLVIHPQNPFVPTSHANLRFFVAEKEGQEPIWWFGGGFDLTPYYGFEDDCKHWHKKSSEACQPFGDDVYAKFKKQCDEYFYLKHRKEPRGIGGLFFDDLNEWGFETTFAFIRSVGEKFIEAYVPIVQKRKSCKYEQKHRDFQTYRRGRYVEFNLVQDRGTLFGLQFGGRTESILISMPPVVSWEYRWQPEANSEEARLYTDFLKPKDWLTS